MRILKIIFALVITLFLSACSNKSTTPLDLNSFNIEKFPKTIYHQTDENKIGNVELYSSRAWFYSIDNKDYSSFIQQVAGIFASQKHSIVMKEGKHKIIYFPHQKLKKTLLFNFKKNHKYFLDVASWNGNYNTIKFQVWLYDITDKQVVLGKKPVGIKYK